VADQGGEDRGRLLAEGPLDGAAVPAVDHAVVAAPTSITGRTSTVP
jgi:hypothetical protein